MFKMIKVNIIILLSIFLLMPKHLTAQDRLFGGQEIVLNFLEYGLAVEHQRGMVNLNSTDLISEVETDHWESVNLGLLLECNIVPAGLSLGFRPKVSILTYFVESKFNSDNLIENGDVYFHIPFSITYTYYGLKASPFISGSFSHALKLSKDTNEAFTLADNFNELLFDIGFRFSTPKLNLSPYVGLNTSISNVYDLENAQGEKLDFRRNGFHLGIRVKG